MIRTSLSGLGSGGPDDNDAQAGRLVAHALTSEGHDASEDGTGRGTPLRLIAAPLAYCLGTQERNTSQGPSNYVTGPLGGGNDSIGRRSEDDPNLVYNPTRSGSRDEHGPLEYWKPDDTVDALHGPTGNKEPLVQGVRRLTTVECCRLQGFPDDHFGIPNETPDSPRYAALGDAVTVNVSYWFGMRFSEADRVETA